MERNLGNLNIVSVPIGNLKDISLRAIEVLKDADIIACEDTRVTGNLLKKLEIKKRGKLISYRDENEKRLTPLLVQEVIKGLKIALVSDAGTPNISDPGFRLINESKKIGIDVSAVPGPCALISALIVSGLPTNKFSFVGFLPPKSSARKKFLSDNINNEYTIILYESCHRIIKLIEEIIIIMGEKRVISVCKELTKIHEKTITNPAVIVKKKLMKMKIKGEFVVMISKRDFIF